MARVHRWLADSYWATEIPFDVVQRSFENSLCFGLFHKGDGQVGVARVITDRSTFAYLGDVFIAEAHRGGGLGDLLMQTIMAHSDLQNLRRMMLATWDMHPLYRKYGFGDIANPERLMEISNPEIYKGFKG